MDQRRHLQRTVLSDQAYVSVRSAILTGQIPFGTQLIVRELSESLGLSPTPIKNALITLESEGLVISIPYRGFFVPSFDISDVLEIYSIREALERKTVRLAALNMTSDVLAELNDILTEQMVCAKEGNTERHVDLDLQFHRSIAVASRNHRLVDMSQAILGQAHLIIASSAVGIGRFSMIHKEHQAILDAFASRDISAAEIAMWKHLQDASKNLMKLYLSEQNEDSSLLNQTDELLTTEQILQHVKQERISELPRMKSLNDTLNDSVKTVIREHLINYVGPIAIFIVSDALSQSSNLSHALKLMASRIPETDKQRTFLQTLESKLSKL